ncbi:S-layer homology domain-containing protein [Candidatus Peregrinibacteria bacterium]|nr:MAG: S-layer homology domain-containing protein [Candidatus Peregrinibacteria bacterium]
MSKSKKIVFALFGLVVLGGLAFAASQSTWLKGTFGQNPGGGTAGSGGLGTDQTSEGGTETDEEEVPTDTGSGGSGTLPVNPNFGGGGLFPPSGTGSNDTPVYIYLSVESQNGDFIEGLSENQFSSDEEFLSFEEENSYYRIEVAEEGNYEVTVQEAGYITRSGTFSAEEEDDTISVEALELPYGHVITVVSNTGSSISGASVKISASRSSLTPCVNYETNKYGCTLAPSSTTRAQYTVSKSGYSSASGTFSRYYTRTSLTSVTATVTLTPVVATPDEEEADEEGDSDTPSQETDPSNEDEDTDSTGTESTPYSCADLELLPNGYQLSANENEKEVALRVTLEFNRPSGSPIKWNDTLILSSSGGQSFESSTGTTGNPLRVDLSTTTGDDVSMDFLVTVGNGDIINAYLSRERSACNDRLVVTQASTDNEGNDDDDDNDDDDSDSANINVGSGGSSSSSRDTILSSEDYTCTDSFTDTENIWAEEIICRMYRAGIVEGRFPPYLFVPNDGIKNSEAIKMIVGLLQEEEEEDAYGLSEGFTDVKNNDWFSPWVKLAEEADIIRTRDFGGYFFPEERITRCQLALNIVRALERTSYNYEMDFSDMDGDEYCAYAVDILSEMEVDVPYDDDNDEVPVIEGYSDGTFRPYRTVSRDEALAMIYRAYLAELAE